MRALNIRPGKHCLAENSLLSRSYALFLIGLLVVPAESCQPKKQGPVAAIAVSRPAPLPVGEKILSKNRRFAYLVRWYAPHATTARLDTVTLTASGEPCSYEATQMCFVWTYHTDSIVNSTPRENVGAIENQEEFWLHPPRRGRYRILELNPFPHIKLPAVSSRTWEWEVYPPDMYADSAWASWKGIVRVTFRYTLGGINQLTTPLGSLACHRIQASGISKLGTTALEAYFHPSYGFVRLNYRNIDASRVQLEMVAVDVRPESNEKAVEQMLWRPSGLQQPK